VGRTRPMYLAAFGMDILAYYSPRQAYREYVQLYIKVHRVGREREREGEVDGWIDWCNII
jgi:hypothetical protein